MKKLSRSLSPNKNVRRFKLAGTVTTKITLKSDWKKIFLLSQAYQIVITSKRYNWNCSYYVIFCDIIKCSVFLGNMKFGRYH